MNNPLFVALDTVSVEQASSLATAVRPHVGGIKLGLEFFCANGPAGVMRVAEVGLPLFLDLKLHDIPNTVVGAVRTLREPAPVILTVHAAGGVAMMREAKAAAPAGCRVVAVTVLTSLDDEDLAAMGMHDGSEIQVDRLSRLAREAGLDGIVCSGREVAMARRLWPEGYFVVPGIRMGGSEAGDQKRVVTPRAAIDDGASVLVVGRPITSAVDPTSAARAFEADLQAA